MAASKPSSHGGGDGDGAPSAAETAGQIKSLLGKLRKKSSSLRRRRRQQRRRSGTTDCELLPGFDREDALRADALRRIFVRLAECGDIDGDDEGGDTGSADDGDDGGKDLRRAVSATGQDEGDACASAAAASSRWRAWLTSQRDAFLSCLVEGVEAGSTSALRTYCGVIASSPVDVVGVAGGGKSSGGMVSERMLNKLLAEGVFKSRSCFEKVREGEEGDDGGGERLETEEPILTLLEAEFVRPHRDVQYFAYKCVRQVALDLLARLDRVRRAADRSTSAERDGGDDDGDDGNGGGGGSCNGAVEREERNAGMVAENMCRLLLMIEYVPKSQDELTGDDSFLFPPPALEANEPLDESDDVNGDYGSNDDDVDSDDYSESSSDDEEEEDGGKKRKRGPSLRRKGKRPKATRYITWQQPYKHRNAHQEAWLAVLRLPNLPARTQKRVLEHLSTYVLATCPSPLRFAEYFTRSFMGGTHLRRRSAADSSGGKGDGGASSVSNSANSLAAILSLDGLFVLMLDHGLEYPRFYDSLYALLHPRVLYTKHRTRFLRLLSRALLSNGMLPAYVVAAYCKRLCRMALSSPPSGGLFVLALVSNLLRKHGECASLIHRKGGGDGMDDVFVEDVDDVAKTRALESSLWELTALERHYHPAISTLAKSIGTENDKTTPLYDMEDFMAHTYKSLFEQEKKRLGSSGNGKKKGGGRVSLTFVEPGGLFAEGDVFSDFLRCS